ncbi:MAG: hypothetical protein WCL00_08265 [Bacteroidota bacterium]
MEPIEKAIIHTLLYFDIFEHPLSYRELYEHTGFRVEKDAFNDAVERLIKSGLIGGESGYYFIRGKEKNISERMIRLERSGRYHRIARFVSWIIHRHPFVRGVFISGSLSKSSISKRDDIDYFVIAQPGRVWICRAILMLFKKLFLLNSRRYFCINYFVDTDHLEIPEKNLFTATELAFLKPMANSELYREFMKKNHWINDFFPNKSFTTDGCMDFGQPIFKRFVERLLQGAWGDRLDNRFLNIYERRSSKRFGATEKEQYQVNFKNEKSIAKYHPRGFQHIILERHKTKVEEFSLLHSVDISIHNQPVPWQTS